jgi:hypothetical protein
MVVICVCSSSVVRVVCLRRAEQRGDLPGFPLAVSPTPTLPKMQSRPLPIPGLPLAPPTHGLTVLEDVIHATSSHAPKPIAPLPTWATVALVADNTGKQSRLYPHGEPQTSQHRPRPQAAAAPIAAATRIAPAAAVAVAPDAMDDDEFPLIPVRRHQKSTPRFEPIRPEAFAYHRHPLAIRTPLDVFRFFPMAVSAAAALAAISGLLAGKIANHVFGGATTPLFFVAGYLAVFLLSLLIHYFSSKGQLFFTCRDRFLRLLAVNALLLSPHFIAYTILMGLAEK